MAYKADTSFLQESRHELVLQSLDYQYYMYEAREVKINIISHNQHKVNYIRLHILEKYRLFFR